MLVKSGRSCETGRFIRLGKLNFYPTHLNRSFDFSWTGKMDSLLWNVVYVLLEQEISSHFQILVRSFTYALTSLNVPRPTDKKIRMGLFFIIEWYKTLHFLVEISTKASHYKITQKDRTGKIRFYSEINSPSFSHPKLSTNPAESSNPKTVILYIMRLNVVKCG